MSRSMALLLQLARLQQMIGYSRRQWLAEAYVRSLELYGVTKVRTKKDGRLDHAIVPLAEVFASSPEP